MKGWSRVVFSAAALMFVWPLAVMWMLGSDKESAISASGWKVGGMTVVAYICFLLVLYNVNRVKR